MRSRVFDLSHELAADVILVPVEDGSVRLLDMAGSFHAVSAVGARMLHAVLADGAAAAVPRLAEHYGVDHARVEGDLTVFLRDLEGRGLLRARGNVREEKRRGLAAPLVERIVGAVHRCVRDPARKARSLLVLARISFGLLGWTKTMEVWRRAHASFPVREPEDADKPILDAVDRTVRAAATGHIVTMMCKESALCSWSLARAAGLDASVVVGIDLYPIAGHCWCEVGTATPGDDADRIERFAPVGRWLESQDQPGRSQGRDDGRFHSIGAR